MATLRRWRLRTPRLVLQKIVGWPVVGANLTTDSPSLNLERGGGRLRKKKNARAMLDRRLAETNGAGGISSIIPST